MKAETAMEIKERQIIFTGDSPRQILNGTKTQTRRVVNFPDSRLSVPMERIIRIEQNAVGDWHCIDKMFPSGGVRYPFPNCPYGKVGDRLWVRETWGYYGMMSGGGKNLATVKFADGSKREVSFPTFEEMFNSTPNQNLKYPADWDGLDDHEKRWAHGELLSKWWDRQKRKPSIHMPRWASRITLEITNIRVDRLQNISEEDAKAEGLEPTVIDEFDIAESITNNPPESFEHQFAKVFGEGQFTAKFNFISLWNEINEKRGFGWLVNPFVWVIEFKKL